MTFYLIPVLLITVSLLIRAELALNKQQIYILKPVSTLLVIAIAALAMGEPGSSDTYTLGVLVGLLLCLGGDLALMFQEHRKPFLLGLVLFFLGHVAYALTFYKLGNSSALDLPVATLLLLAGLACFRLMAPGLGAMKLPVIAYFLIISVMVSSAVSLTAGAVLSDLRVKLVVIGALLFYLSDVILAANRFWKPWKYNRFSLAFYYGGQILIAVAAHPF